MLDQVDIGCALAGGAALALLACQSHFKGAAECSGSCAAKAARSVSARKGEAVPQQADPSDPLVKTASRAKASTRDIIMKKADVRIETSAKSTVGVSVMVAGRCPEHEQQPKVKIHPDCLGPPITDAQAKAFEEQHGMGTTEFGGKGEAVDMTKVSGWMAA